MEQLSMQVREIKRKGRSVMCRTTSRISVALRGLSLAATLFSF